MSTENLAVEIDLEHQVLGSMLAEYHADIEMVQDIIVEKSRLSGCSVAYLNGSKWREVTTRHLLILAMAADAMNIDMSEIADVAAGIILAYTVPLTAIDRLLDDQPELYTNEEHYASLLEATHLGYAWCLSATSNKNIMLHVCRMSLATSAGMLHDASIRNHPYDTTKITESDIDHYWNSPTSRLNGSNIARLMIGICSIVRYGTENDAAILVGQTVGRLRQVADELLDVGEDLASGLITLPIMYALVRREYISCIRSAISLSASQELTIAAKNRVRAAITESGAAEHICKRSDLMLLRGARAAEALTSGRGEMGLLGLLAVRRLQIDRAIRQGYTDENRLSAQDLRNLSKLADWRAESRHLLENTRKVF